MVGELPGPDPGSSCRLLNVAKPVVDKTGKMTGLEDLDEGVVYELVRLPTPQVPRALQGKFDLLKGEARPRKKRRQLVARFGASCDIPADFVPTVDLLALIERELGQKMSRSTLRRKELAGVITPADFKVVLGSRGGRPTLIWPLASTLEALAEHLGIDYDNEGLAA